MESSRKFRSNVGPSPGCHSAGSNHCSTTRARFLRRCPTRTKRMCSARSITGSPKLDRPQLLLQSRGAETKHVQQLRETNENCRRQLTHQVCIRVLLVPTLFGTVVDE